MSPQDLVQREVIYCVSSLIYDLREVAEQLDDYDTYLNLTGGKPDYEEAARFFIENDAYLDDLEEISEQYAWWSDVIEAVKDASTTLLQPYVVEYTEGDCTDYFECWAKDREDAREQCLEMNDAEINSVSVNDEPMFDDWCDNNPGLLEAVREQVWKVVSLETDAFEWVCDNFNLEPEYNEIFEHWIVSEWLGRKLSERGHVVESYLGLTIWGRPCTGQAIYMDGVMEQICNEL